MGLFSFLKKAGSDLLKSSAEKNAEAAASAEAAKANKINLLESVINGSGIPVENFSVDLDDDKITVYGQTNSVEDKEKVILILGNMEGIATVDDRLSVVTPPQSTFYEVKSGDSLSKIAKEVYGDAMRYNEIFEANQPMLKSPDLIYPGQMLRIPNK
ncbi:MAG TPA: peptidoglycan-binding protein LysM [Saprospiraceae bacterium]|nr:peptidoglycan-binding protein LysM [Lewinellaceae bacterium]HPQ20603.1 peptidoglycan-binding protein LysM [Saprospiraceae bacterium]HRX29570.1 peptidoglycan-binding protein LysM [Saprospiraceae bacterium]